MTTKNNHIFTASQHEEALRVLDEMMSNLDNGALQELMGGYENDINKLFDALLQETLEVLYGSGGLVKESSTGYLSKLHKGLEETLRVENLNYFLVSLFPEFDINWHHLEWGEFGRKFNKLNIIAARDHGKSYYWSNIFPAWKMYRYKPKNQMLAKPRKELYLCGKGSLITNDADLGIELMEILKNTIEDNPILADKLLPENKRENWANTRIRCKNGATFKAKSYGSRFRGRHPGWMVVDDLLDDKQIYSKEQREKAINWFHSVLMNALVKDGQVIVAGTPFHSNDLYADLKKKKDWRVFEYPSIMPNGMELWENRYSLSELISKKDSIGSLAFSREHLCRPIVSDSSLFTRKLIESCFSDKIKLINNIDNSLVKYDYVITGCDFALSASTGADYSVFMTWGIDKYGQMWLLHMWRGKGKSFAEQLSVLQSIHRNFRPNVMYLEQNQFQQIFVQEADKKGLPVIGHHTGTSKYDFKKGLPGLVLLMERGKIKLPYSDTQSINTSELIASELGSIAWTDKGLQGVGNHDDAAMCVWISSCAARDVSYGFGGMFI